MLGEGTTEIRDVFRYVYHNFSLMHIANVDMVVLRTQRIYDIIELWPYPYDCKLPSLQAAFIIEIFLFSSFITGD